MQASEAPASKLQTCATGARFRDTQLSREGETRKQGVASSPVIEVASEAKSTRSSSRRLGRAKAGAIGGPPRLHVYRAWPLAMDS